MGKAKTALLVPFCALLVAGCASQSDYDTLQQRYAQTQATNQKLQSENQALQAQMQQNQPPPNQENTYTISADTLFAPHGVSLSTGGQAALNDIAARLRGIKNKIVVYGYTDDENVGPPLKKMGINSNMELSSKRAEMVADYLRAHGIDPALISAKGRAETHPLAPNDSATGRAKNRRVEIVVGGSGS
ncbi:MAG TPA: OmpA family protein [Stellaceae bacterium]|jgi:chemotaxis protein MotB|nr:OmpA family protein [Stellaceae bacterium]